MNGSEGEITALVPSDLADREFAQFPADGFASPVCGVVFGSGDPPCCGVPLGGLGTGCLDIDARGVWGFSSIFNPVSPLWAGGGTQMPRKPPRPEPILGLSVGGDTWVLATEQLIGGGVIAWCSEPAGATEAPRPPVPVAVARIEGVKHARRIRYWGHYPVADLEYETDAPIGVGMRAWSPFVPGDAGASNIPAAVFEVRLRNSTASPLGGTVAVSFPGPDAQEARGSRFTRQPVREDYRGVLVTSTGGVGYVLGVLGEVDARFGAGLGSRPEYEETHAKLSPKGRALAAARGGTPDAWSVIASRLPEPDFSESGGVRSYADGSASAAVDFALEAHEERRVRFFVAWHAPVLEGASRHSGPRAEKRDKQMKIRWLRNPWAGDTNEYVPMYAARYQSVLDVARRVALEHEALLARVLAWQSAVYGDEELPVWLKDCLVNSLALLAEDSYWVQAREPLGDWVYPEGAFALNESPRGCPQTSCLPCEWIGSLPVLYLFPSLARQNLRLFMHNQLADGEIPFALGELWNLPDFATPEYWWQVSLNGTWYASMVDRLWRRTGDDAVLHEFYGSVKRCTTFTMHLAPDPARAIRMPDRGGSEWFEHGVWLGKVTHIGGLRLAHLRIMERMAEKMGDAEYAARCRAWFVEGSAELERSLWADTHYLNFYDEASGRTSSEVLANQLDGDFLARHHGLDPVFMPERAARTLETIRRFNVTLASGNGALLFATPDGHPIADGTELTSYGAYNLFPSNSLLLFATYCYAGQQEAGLEMARRMYGNLVLRQGHPWDLPNIVRGDTGKRSFGTDYSQMMVLWALVPALRGEDVAAPCAPGGLVERMIRTAAGSDA